jgi:uncharacterized membrane protein (DUF4010 family)
MENAISQLDNPLAERLLHLTVSLCIGFLIGLEREYSKPVSEKQFAGVRTHTLIALFGFISALLAEKTGQCILVASFLSLVLLVAVSYMQLAKETRHMGGTSEITSLITFLLAVLVFYNYMLLAAISMVIILLLLTFKPPLHLLAKKITHTELLAIIQFIIISAIIIPFLPELNFGPYRIWNLKDIWKMVVLVSGISLTGYLLSKLLGNKGILISGILGGLASSTMVSLVYSKRSRESQDAVSNVYALAIVSSCTMMFIRILFELYIVNRMLVPSLLPAFATITASGVLMAFIIYKAGKAKTGSDTIQPENPLNLKTAVQFALIYAAVLWLVRYCNEQFGARGSYAAGIISGVADLDAITISMARSGLEQMIIGKTILLAAISNTIVKLIIALIFGNNILRKWVSMGLTALIVAGIISYLVL